MKTGKSVFKYLLVFAFLFLTIQGLGQEGEVLITKNRTLEKSFDNKDISSLFVSNNFGDVNISIWQEDFISMKITVEVIGWDEDEVDVFLEQVFPDPEVKGTMLLSTINSKNIKDICCPDVKKVYRPLFKKNASVKQFSINYEIQMPETINFLNILNAYGNISLPSYSGQLAIRLRNGILKTGNLNLDKCNCPSLSIRYGNINLGEVKNASFNLYSCDLVKIATLENSTINSSFSNVQIGTANSLKLQTKSDAYVIKKLDSLNGRGQFTTLSINYLESYLNFYNRSGEIEIMEINPTFHSIILDGQFNHYALQVNDLSYLFSAKLESTDMKCSENICSELFKTQAMNASVTFNNRVGEPETFSKISLSCTNCNIELLED